MGEAELLKELKDPPGRGNVLSGPGGSGRGEIMQFLQLSPGFAGAGPFFALLGAAIPALTF